MRLLIITGMSGAGKSQVVDFLEDQNWFCIDNLPPALILKFTQLWQPSEESHPNVALVVDVRGGEFFGDFLEELRKLDERHISYELLFLDSNDETLIKRYKEGRRRHPLASKGRLVDSLKQEREALANIKFRATYYIDTSLLTPKKLRSQVETLVLEGQDLSDSFSVTILSFGFKYGLPLDVDMVFDVRFLPNPYYVEELRLQTGEDPEVQNYIAQWPETEQYWVKMLDLIEFVLPQYMKEGRKQIVIGIGCTGGQHRSVYLSCRLFEILQKKNYKVILSHRDVKRHEY